MTKLRLVVCLCICALIISSCSIEINQDVSATPSSQALAATNAAAQPNALGNPTLPTFKIAVTWGSLNLTGRLIYTSAGQNGNTPYERIQMLDLANGEGATIFEG